VLLGLLLLATPIISVTAAGLPEPRCPSPGQVAAALAAKLPETVPGPEQDPSSDHLRLEILQRLPGPSPSTIGRVAGRAPDSPPPAPLQIDLWDDADRLQLRRILPGSKGDDRAACLALAETVALIVDRYIHTVERPGATAGTSAGGPTTPLVAVPSLPSPSPPTDVAVLAGASWRGDADPLQGFEALAGVDLQRMTRERGGGVALTVGIAPAVEGNWAAGRATLRRIPLRLGTYVSLRAGLGRLEPGLNLGIDVLLVDMRPTVGAARAVHNRRWPRRWG
jgi:hypothetical protein